MANLKTLNEIFNNTIYRIPDFQRGYAWRPEQLADFWDDLYNLSNNRNHYTGVITVKFIPPTIFDIDKWHEEQWLVKERGYRAFYVVDGQQRLTTSIIFIQSLVEIVRNLSHNAGLEDSDICIGAFTLKEIKETFLVINKPPHNIIKTYKFGYESDNPSFDFLRYKIFNQESSGTVNETFYTLNLENAKRFFNEKLKVVLELQGEEGMVELFRKLTVNFKFNLYEIEEDFDVFVAFETMNNRGKKLSNLELLKNRLIYLTTLYDPNELNEDDRISLRIKIDSAWKEVYYQLGRNKYHPLNDDEFLVAHWIMYFQYKRQKGEDYIDFLLNEQFTPKNIFEKVEIPVSCLEEIQELRDIDDIYDEENGSEEEETTLFRSKLKPKEIEDYVLSLQSASLNWFNTFNPINNKDLNKTEQQWIDRLNRIGISYFRPLITASYLNEEVTSNQRVKLFKSIERYIFIAFRLKNALSNYGNSEFFKAARMLREGAWDIEYIIGLLETRLEFIFSQNEDGDEFIDTSLFKKYIEKNFNNNRGFYWWNSIRYFLYEYEMDLVKQRGNQKIDWKLFVKNEKDKLTIEHILPQTPDKACWRKILKHYNPKEITRLTGTLGNLVPLSKSINSSLQNDCFEEKVKAKLDKQGKKIRLGYNDGSHSEIEISQKPKWTSDEILKRGLDLLDFMEKRWNFKFESKESKIELLGLSFLNKKKK